MTEANLMRAIMLAHSNPPGTLLFRNNTGTAWQGNRTVRRGDAVIIHDPRPVHFGLCKGSSDIIGLRSITITPEMVGQQLAVFTAIEVKGPRGRATEQQQRFIEAVRSAGGFAGIARSVDEAGAIIAPAI